MHQSYRRYEIPTREAPPAAFVPNRFKPVVDRLKLAKLLIKEALHYRFNRELLLSRPCIYGVFGGPVGGFWPLTQKCVGCMRCVQEYPDMCRVLIDERWKKMGDSYFTPDAISTLNQEASTGKIPVKGVGYKGPFTGEGFDALWTDMSEIVRPTRDGIYGRENIATAVDIGRKPKKVDEGPQWPIVEIPLPMIFDELPEALSHPSAARSVERAADKLRTFYVSRKPPRTGEELPFWVPLGDRIADLARLSAQARVGVRLYEFAAEGAGPGDLERAAAAFPQAIAAARLPLGPEALKRVLELYRQGVGVFHLAADYHGKESRTRDPRFIKDSLLDLHRALVKEGVRDEITVIASGGIVRAEHVPKTLLCGADLVALDTPILVALNAEFTGECRDGLGGLKARKVDPAWGESRILNLCAAWRNQLLEIASAMGIRDVRRMRGETGRAIFYEDLAKDWLAPVP